MSQVVEVVEAVLHQRVICVHIGLSTPLTDYTPLSMSTPRFGTNWTKFCSKLSSEMLNEIFSVFSGFSVFSMKVMRVNWVKVALTATNWLPLTACPPQSELLTLCQRFQSSALSPTLFRGLLECIGGDRNGGRLGVALTALPDALIGSEAVRPFQCSSLWSRKRLMHWTLSRALVLWAQEFLNEKTWSMVSIVGVTWLTYRHFQRWHRFSKKLIKQATKWTTLESRTSLQMTNTLTDASGDQSRVRRSGSSTCVHLQSHNTLVTTLGIDYFEK